MKNELEGLADHLDKTPKDYKTEIRSEKTNAHTAMQCKPQRCNMKYINGTETLTFVFLCLLCFQRQQSNR